jgi:hypothetical protein
LTSFLYLGEQPMIEVMYDPSDVGKIVTSSRGNQVKIRKYHMTTKEMKAARKRFEELTINVPQSIKDKAGPIFFNPFRMGIYYGQIQAMYLLGCNQWHDYKIIERKVEEFLSNIMIVEKRAGVLVDISVWDKFKSKLPKSSINRSKDVMGRIRENMVFFQRLTKLHPCGYKLRQVYAAVDIKKVSKDGFPNGLFYYRLSTYNTEKEAIPIRDYSEFAFSSSGGKFVSKKFIGKIITKDKVLLSGVTI